LRRKTGSSDFQPTTACRWWQRLPRGASGDVLVFTEAHAIPEPDTLERVDHALRQHPEWSGFSFRSVPITHNLLSEIEAQMYGSDIERNMADHPWLEACR
jgi:hypothetical protein